MRLEPPVTAVAILLISYIKATEFSLIVGKGIFTYDDFLKMVVIRVEEGYLDYFTLFLNNPFFRKT